MIPFASQRASGADLATHLMNAEDNERVQVMDMRGAIAQDLHGAFAEWQLQAETFTNCRNYLYSLSVNPDPEQDPLTIDQYRDYVDRVEKALGLEGQPRAIVFHVKHDRAHVHVVWSRIDAKAGKAVQLSFDREKLMRVTRQFARDHGIALPKGYERDHEETEKSGQLSLYEKYQQDTTGLTKVQRVELVTDLWRRSDSAKAFVRALGENGYMLARGNRPYVLVDIHGDTNALPKLIGDKQVRTKDVRAFLEKDFPPESLPSVDEAKALAAKLRKEKNLKDTIDREAEKKRELGEREATRREAILEKFRALEAEQQKERSSLADRQNKEVQAFREKRLQLARYVREKRQQARPKGLAKFLGRVTGMDRVVRRVRQFRDRKRVQQTRALQGALAARHEKERLVLTDRHQLQMKDVRREARGVMKVEHREQRSRAVRQLRRDRMEQRARQGIDHLNAIDQKRYGALLKPISREPEKETSERKSRSLAQWRSGVGRLTHLFTKATDDDRKKDSGDRGEKGKDLERKLNEERARKRRRDRDQDR